jgi:threonine/homoserine/homoserine lactone efflux protein
MIDLQLFAVFMVGAVALNLTPGPDMTLVLAQSAGRGVRAGLAAALGIGVGALFHMALAAFGLAALLAASPLAFDTVRYAGAAYLVWIAWSLIRSPRAAGPTDDSAAEALTARAFRQGVITNVLNPKVALFFMAYLPQFVNPDIGPAWVQILILGLAFDISGTVVNGLVALGGGRLGQHVKSNPGLNRAVNWLAASVTAGLALRLVWPDKR